MYPSVETKYPERFALAAHIAFHSPRDGKYQSLFPPELAVMSYAKPHVQPASIFWVFQ
jgi:hypothetical protein